MSMILVDGKRRAESYTSSAPVFPARLLATMNKTGSRRLQGLESGFVLYLPSDQMGQVERLCKVVRDGKALSAAQLAQVRNRRSLPSHTALEHQLPYYSPKSISKFKVLISLNTKTILYCCYSTATSTLSSGEQNACLSGHPPKRSPSHKIRVDLAAIHYLLSSAHGCST
jgi:hypothetical protein